jgi:glycosyltransferase involved in cell wall biosynthesis
MGLNAMTTPFVSVIMSVWNDAAFVGQAIDSILQQSFADFEFLIVDDHSSDGSAAVIAQHAAIDARIRVLPTGNKGRVAALNRLLREARGPLVALMDSDDLSAPERFSRQLAFLNAHPDHGAVSCDCDKIDSAGIMLDRPPIDRPSSHAGLVANFESGPLLNHNAVMMRRATLVQIGGYRAAFRHAEDYDLWLRLSEVAKLANLPETLVTYRIHARQVSTANLVEQTRNAALAWLAYCTRREGRSDPSARLTALPDLDGIDAAFGAGSAAYVRRRIVERILYAPEALAGDGWSALLGHIDEAGPARHLWRATARLAAGGKPLHAARAALALTKAGIAA